MPIAIDASLRLTVQRRILNIVEAYTANYRPVSNLLPHLKFIGYDRQLATCRLLDG